MKCRVFMGAFLAGIPSIMAILWPLAPTHSSPKNRSRNDQQMKQAVVVIHGIGEQRPMDTLRSFVEAMIPTDTPEATPFYWSKPDRFSRNFDLRVLKSAGRNTTDFYEYYWAHKMQGTKVGHLLSWLWDIFKRPRRDIPTAIVPIWRATRWTLLALLVLLVSGTLATLYGQLPHSDNPFALIPVLLAVIGL